MGNKEINEETLLLYVSAYFCCTREMAQILILSAKHNNNYKTWKAPLNRKFNGNEDKLMTLIDLVIKHFGCDRLKASQIIEQYYNDGKISELKMIVGFNQ